MLIQKTKFTWIQSWSCCQLFQFSCSWKLSWLQSAGCSQSCPAQESQLPSGHSRHLPPDQEHRGKQDNILFKKIFVNNIVSVWQQQIIVCRLRDGAGSVWFVVRTDQLQCLRLRQCPGQAETMGSVSEWRIQQQIQVGGVRNVILVVL